jgi:hypothetical protein
MGGEYPQISQMTVIGEVGKVIILLIVTICGQFLALCFMALWMLGMG